MRLVLSVLLVFIAALLVLPVWAECDRANCEGAEQFLFDAWPWTSLGVLALAAYLAVSGAMGRRRKWSQVRGENAPPSGRR